MGRIKTTLIKRVSLKLLEMHREKFTEDFKENKAVIGKFTDVSSVKLKNAIAGYVTRLVRRGDIEKRPYVAKRNYEIQG